MYPCLSHVPLLISYISAKRAPGTLFKPQNVLCCVHEVTLPLTTVVKKCFGCQQLLKSSNQPIKELMEVTLYFPQCMTLSCNHFTDMLLIILPGRLAMWVKVRLKYISCNWGHYLLSYLFIGKRWLKTKLEVNWKRKVNAHNVWSSCTHAPCSWDDPHESCQSEAFTEEFTKEWKGKERSACNTTLFMCIMYRLMGRTKHVD